MIKLKELRKNANRKQIEVAENLGVSFQAYSNWENENRQADYDTLIKLADYFGVSIDYLLGHDTKDSNSIVEFADGLIADDFFKKNTALLCTQDFIDLAKLYNIMTNEYKSQILAYVLGIASGLDLDIKNILGK